MSSFQIAITPSRRAAGRFISKVRRTVQKALAEEETENGIRQADIARAIGVNRSVIHREIRGHKDLTLGRLAEIAWALGRQPEFVLTKLAIEDGGNHGQVNPGALEKPPMPGATKSESTPSGSGVEAKELEWAEP